MIPKEKEQRIKASARIADVLAADGVKLHRKGANLYALCPFHDDHSIGSFVVSERRNICRCFACDKTWSPVEYLLQRHGMKYPDALRYLAGMYGIWLDEGRPSKSHLKGDLQRVPVTPITPIEELPVVYFPKDLPDRYMGNQDKNPLLVFLRNLPLDSTMQLRLTTSMYVYKVGTSMKEATAGWTVWWQIDDAGQVRTGKLMAYRSDGHRDKARKYSFNWVHSMLEKAGWWSSEQKRMEQCLFGLHLVDMYPAAEVCIVESEKSALICSLFTDAHVRLWMATGGKANLNGRMLEPLMKRERYIVLFPDADGYDEWERKVRQDPDLEDYPRLSISRTLQKHWTVRDGAKADIADVMLRMLQDPTEETTAEKAACRLGMEHVSEPLSRVIETFDLEFE